MTHYTSQSYYFGPAVQFKELTWMTRKKFGRYGRYRTYKGTTRNCRANGTYRTYTTYGTKETYLGCIWDMQD